MGEHTKLIKKIYTSFHPFLFALYPVLILYTNNIQEVALKDTCRALLILILGTAFFLAITYLITRNFLKSSLITSVLILLTFNFGHLYDLLRHIKIADLTLFRYRTLFPLVIIFFLIWVLWVIKWSKSLKNLEMFFLLFGFLSLVSPMYLLGDYYLNAIKPQTLESGQNETIQTRQNQPDIYYIILDGYTNNETLQSIYSHDNSYFTHFLTDQGFYVAKDSHSNYVTTHLSLSSSLNMQYLDTLIQSLDSESNDLRQLKELITHSQVRANFEQLGYQMVAFETGWRHTQVENADIYLQPKNMLQQSPLLNVSLNNFEMLLLSTTPVRIWIDRAQASIISTQAKASADVFKFPFLNHRNRILFALSSIEEIPSWDGDYFVFVHLIMPHPPFTFGKNGEIVIPSYVYTLQDGNGFPGTREEYIDGYRNQVIYLNWLLENALTKIIQNSETPPIIILQGDHGPRLGFNYESLEQSNLQESFSILNAYYFPGLDTSFLYSSITPVNSFRLLFNNYFNGQYKLLVDSNYFSTHSKPFTFIDITSQLKPEQ